MDYLPAFLQIRDQQVLLVGGGTVATRKARLLHRAGARLRVVAPWISDELRLLLEEQQGHWLERLYRSSDLEDVSLVVAATSSEEVNAAVSSDAQQRRLPVNVVDAPALCSFIFPAIVDRSPILIGISSSGSSPVVARWVRSRIESMLPRRIGALAEFVREWRDRSKSDFPIESERRRFWEQVIEGPIAELVLCGSKKEADVRILERLGDPDGRPQGEVILIGAGPGDPELMTFKALRLLQRADVVVYDRLVDASILEMARRDAERVYVGKSRAQHTLAQAEINALLLSYAQQGKTVARLKGGDPFIFGRGGEELELLARHRIPFQVVPGITAASGCAAYAGIPLTHRSCAHSVRFVAGYQQGSYQIPWHSLQDPTETLVFYMGLHNLEEICIKLVAAGRSTQTPAALIDRGTLPDQQVLSGTLATLPALTAQHRPQGPALLVIGDVVSLRENAYAVDQWRDAAAD